MFVVAVYDIETVTKEGRRRLPKVMKTFRKYLHHTQRSVFEGEITEAKFRALKSEVNEIIDKEVDYIVFYRADNKNNLSRENLGKDFDPNVTII